MSVAAFGLRVYTRFSILQVASYEELLLTVALVRYVILGVPPSVRAELMGGHRSAPASLSRVLGRHHPA